MSIYWFIFYLGNSFFFDTLALIFRCFQSLYFFSYFSLFSPENSICSDTPLIYIPILIRALKYANTISIFISKQLHQMYFNFSVHLSYILYFIVELLIAYKVSIYFISTLAISTQAQESR